MLGEIHPLVQDIFFEKFSCDLEKGIKVTKTNQGFDIPKLQVWKILSTGLSHNIFLRMNQHMILKIGSKSTKPNPCTIIIKCYIFASFVTTQLFLQEIMCRQVSYQGFFCPHVTLKIGSISPKFIHFYSTYKYIHIYVWF